MALRALDIKMNVGKAFINRYCLSLDESMRDAMRQSEPLKQEEIRGIIPPLVSTFGVDGELDLARFAAELEFMEELGIRLAVVGGSTGSGDELTPEELGSLVETATSKSSLRVIAGVITTSTKHAIRRGITARDAGACALMLGPPIYNTPSPAGLDRYIRDVVHATSLPIVYYNHFFSPASVMQRIAGLDGVICLKEVALEVVAELVQTVGDKVVIAAGADAVNVASFLLGADAAISGINTVIPKQYIEIYQAHLDRDYSLARELTERIGPIAREMIKPVNFPARVKYAINLLGRDVGEPRAPSGDLDEADKKNIRIALKTAGLLP
jgi:4-hydroxy-tetrahydrodipicolinate synthase